MLKVRLAAIINIWQKIKLAWKPRNCQRNGIRQPQNHNCLQRSCFILRNFITFHALKICWHVLISSVTRLKINSAETASQTFSFFKSFSRPFQKFSRLFFMNFQDFSRLSKIFRDLFKSLIFKAFKFFPKMSHY